MKYIAIPITALLLLVSGTQVWAEETNTDVSASVEQKDSETTANTEAKVEVKRPTLPVVPGIFKTSAEDVKAKLQHNLSARKENREEKREETKATIEARKAEMAATREEKHEGIKTAIEARKAEFHAKREEMKIKIEAHKAEMKAKLLEIKKEHIAVRKEYVYGRLVSAVAIIEARQSRVEAMLEKMKARSIDTASAEAALKVSVDALMEAKASLSALKSAEASAETEAAALKALAQKVEASVKASREALIKVLDIIAPESAVSASTDATVQ